ncbi:hypothetical protein P154DRAFT_557791 [Amniculicola lignicola CBS 123094]|uniref:Ribosome biogenesis protein Urb1 n=1 Tax=Amniculicola lignicola CBS 123094 TaxID=1392246 RepID=A0A6A5VU66_9PLEO|nr:hypothetical protein P154DRAFT_557791 [Amniculicola lignicola CBS 123094]
MAKRAALEADPSTGTVDRHVKRQRVIGSDPAKASTTVEEVTSAGQLQKALVFEQGATSALRNGLVLLKSFLDSILYSAEEHDVPCKRAILREYLETQKGSGRDSGESTFMQHLTKTWDYAAETNQEAILTQVTANVALLLRVFSSHPDLLEYGPLLSKAVLHSSVARRFNRSLSAPSSKENLISPVLRMLTELTKFDEGALAKAVYAKREFTLDPKLLARNITLWRDSKGDAMLDYRKPSIRVNAVRYLLTHLKYQGEDAKIEILSNTFVVRGLFDHVFSDPPFLIFEIFDTMKNHVFLDRVIPRSVKSRILTGKTLSHIASLYRYECAEGTLAEGQKTPDVIAHEFLSLVCTSPAYGVMLPSNGFYPPTSDSDGGDVVLEDAPENALDIGLDPTDFLEGQGRIRNIILREFSQSLKPHANILQQELVIAIFRVCPELVADYFLHKEAFHYDPNLTSTWLGYSSFLYATIELPVPRHFGDRRNYRDYPPAISTVLQCIIPQPLNQLVLTRCLNHSSELINFFVLRVLIVAFRKLRTVLEAFSTASASTSSKSWEYGSRRLLAEFAKRCPLMKNIVLAYRRPAYQKNMLREAIVRLLQLYYEVTPQEALEETFDASLSLCNALVQAEKPTDAPEDQVLRIIELEHWIQIAKHSSTMRWWSKTKALQYSPFVTMLRLVSTSARVEQYSGVKDLLFSILNDHEMLQTHTFPDAFEALVASIGPSCGSSSPAPQVLEFLDDCLARFTKAPIKYFDDLDAIRGDLSNTVSSPLSPLLMVLVEQWSFKGGKVEKDNSAEPLAHWLAKLLYLLKLIGESEALLEILRDSLVATAQPAYHGILKDAFLWKMGKQSAKEALKKATGADFSGSERSSTSPVPQENPSVPAKTTPAIDLEFPPEEDEKHSGLNRWRKKDLDEAIDNGDIGELLLCLCSRHGEIRLQAVTGLRQLAASIKPPNNPDYLQLYILLSEVVGTVQPTIGSQPFPYVGGVFAARAVLVLADPTHILFAKINEFLLKRPEWSVENIPRYFGKAIINSPPEQDGAYHKEVDWFLDYLIDCLRTPEDMEIFRTRNVFERILTYYTSYSCAISAKEKIVRLLLRAAAVGGSTTLITRCGIVAWIQIRLDMSDHRHRTLRLLASRVWDTCDREKVDAWSAGTMEECIQSLIS